jgi:hypothetical protein
MKINIASNTAPITPGAVASKSFSFTSGGGGGSGGVTKINSSGVISGGITNPAIIPIPLATEVDLFTGPFTFTGGKPGVGLFYVNISGVSGPNLAYKIKSYLDALLAYEVTLYTAQAIDWGYYFSSSLGGLHTTKLAIENIGGATFLAGPCSGAVLEFQ